MRNIQQGVVKSTHADRNLAVHQPDAERWDGSDSVSVFLYMYKTGFLTNNRIKTGCPQSLELSLT